MSEAVLVFVSMSMHYAPKLYQCLYKFEFTLFLKVVSVFISLGVHIMPQGCISVSKFKIMHCALRLDKCL